MKLRNALAAVAVGTGALVGASAMADETATKQTLDTVEVDAFKKAVPYIECMAPEVDMLQMQVIIGAMAGEKISKEMIEQAVQKIETACEEKTGYESDELTALEDSLKNKYGKDAEQVVRNSRDLISPAKPAPAP